MRPWIGLVVAIGLAAALAACGDGGNDEAKRKEVEELARQLPAASAADVDFFLEHMTDRVLEEFFGYTRRDCREQAAECVGEGSTVNGVSNTEVLGDSARTDIDIADFGQVRVTFVLDDGVWKVDKIEPVPRAIPEGVDKVELTLDDFSFAFDGDAVSAGHFAFVIDNAGKQPHEVIVTKVPEGFDVEAALQSESEPPGVSDVAFAGPFTSGSDGTLVFDQDLEPGEYVLLCFLPDRNDPQRTPHAMKGMWAKFTVGG
jgi:hypothetical protein